MSNVLLHNLAKYSHFEIAATADAAKANQKCMHLTLLTVYSNNTLIQTQRKLIKLSHLVLKSKQTHY